MMNVGIYGGTFDPVHNGHVETARYLISSGSLDKIIFIPAFISPHKLESQSAMPTHRLNMLKLAVGSIPSFEISSYEIEKPEPSYSIDTVKHFLKYFPKLSLIIGADNIEKFHTWKNVDELVSLVKILVLYRTTNEFIIEKSLYPFADFLNTPGFDVSSSQIRKNINEGKSISDLVPPSVNDYILKNNLYK